MSALTDHDLRTRFERLRTAEATSAPEFRKVLAHANHMAEADRRARRNWRRVAIPVALGAAIVVVAGIVRVSRHRQFAAPPLSAWTSPTSALLHTPDIGLLAPPFLVTSALLQ
ncbi:MAG: hypothetical protein ACHQWU_06280 [Gemmatimonadales bacterium]